MMTCFDGGDCRLAKLLFGDNLLPVVVTMMRMMKAMTVKYHHLEGGVD